MAPLLLLGFLGVSSALSIGAESEANPMRRVITILQDMQKELQEEAHKEEDLYNNYECYCTKNTEGMSAEAVAAKQKIEELTARGEAEKAEKTQLDQDVKQHIADRKQATHELEVATTIRNKEHQAFVEENAEFLDNIRAINAAVDALEKGVGLRLMQGAMNVRLTVISAMSGKMLDRHQQKVLAAFLQGKSPYGAYQTSSSEVVGILKQMKERMDQDLGGVVSREEAAAAAFKELKAAKLQQIQAQTDAIESKQVRSGELAVAYVVTQNELKDTRDSLSATERFMADLSIACDAKKSDYEERLKTRADEIRAISEAIEVLNNDDALDIFKTTLDKPSPALLQKTSESSVAGRARSLLQHAHKSRNAQFALLESLLNQKVGKVDFSKIVSMIDQMVAVLKREQDDDNSKRDWCHVEFDSNDDKTKASARKMRSLASFIEEAKARVSILADEIATSEADMKAIDKAVAEATEQRKKEHEEFLQSQTELTAARQLIGKAVNRLNRFYNPALYKEPEKRQLTEEERIAKNLGQDIDETSQKKIAGTDITVEYMQKPKAATLVQIRSHISTEQSAPPPPPETWDAYKKKDPQNRGVVYILGRLMQDLKSDQEEGQHDEQVAQRDYEKMMSESRATRDSLTARIATDESAKAELQEKIGDAGVGHQVQENTTMDLKQSLSELHGACDFLLQHFVLRKEARSNEISGLEQAKAVLAGASYQ